MLTFLFCFLGQVKKVKNWTLLSHRKKETRNRTSGRKCVYLILLGFTGRVTYSDPFTPSYFIISLSLGSYTYTPVSCRLQQVRWDGQRAVQGTHSQTVQY